MRRRASGFGVRISSIDLANRRLHWADDRLDERDLLRGDAVLSVEVGVGPVTIPRLDRNPAVHGTKGVLTDLPQGHQEAQEPRRMYDSALFASSSEPSGPAT